MVELALLLVAGVAAGVAGSAAGLASLISYPALLAVGLPPVAANVTNTVALVGSGIGAALGSRTELRGQSDRLRRLAAVAVVGGAVGSALLLLTPPEAFERVVPLLVAAAALVILLQPPPQELTTLHADPRLLPVAVLLVAVYGGYFGAAAGVVLLALLLTATREPLPRSNATKNVLLGLANGVAAVGFVLFGPVRWAAVLPLAAGFLIGGRLGPALVRRLPTRLLRAVIGVAGLALAAVLAGDAYG